MIPVAHNLTDRTQTLRCRLSIVFIALLPSDFICKNLGESDCLSVPRLARTPDYSHPNVQLQDLKEHNKSHALTVDMSCCALPPLSRTVSAKIDNRIKT